MDRSSTLKMKALRDAPSKLYWMLDSSLPPLETECSELLRERLTEVSMSLTLPSDSQEDQLKDIRLRLTLREYMEAM